MLKFLIMLISLISLSTVDAHLSLSATIDSATSEHALDGRIRLTIDTSTSYDTGLFYLIQPDTSFSMTSGSEASFPALKPGCYGARAALLSQGRCVELTDMLFVEVPIVADGAKHLQRFDHFENEGRLSERVITAVVGAQPTTRCSSDGRIELSPLAEAVNYSLTDGSTTWRSLEPTFSHLPPGYYFGSALLPDGERTASASVHLESELTPTFQICEFGCLGTELLLMPTDLMPGSIITGKNQWTSWRESETPTIVGTGPILSVSGPGNYTACVTFPGRAIDRSPVTATATKFVTNDDLSSFGICGSLSVCQGNALTLCVKFHDETRNSSDYSYQWTGDCCTDPCTDQCITFTPSTSGTCTVAVTNHITGSTQLACVSYTVTPPPTVTMKDVCLCMGQPLILEVTVTTADQAEVIVTGPLCFNYSTTVTGTTTLDIPVNKAATDCHAGCYFVTVIDVNGCIVGNVPIRVIVCPCCIPS